jgi:O-methyltransferase
MESDEPRTMTPPVVADAPRAGLVSNGGADDDYLSLLKRTLTATIHQDVYTCSTTFDRPNLRQWPWTPRRWAVYYAAGLVRLLGWELVKRSEREPAEQGRAWPLVGETMVGMARLDNLHSCLEAVVREGVPGDFIETGVWRGGSSIFARGVFKALGVHDRQVWVADSFAGLPPPDGRYAEDAGDMCHSILELAIPLEVVKENFRRYGLLDEQVRFLPGWFRDTLPTLEDHRWAVIRLDGDMYASTMDALENLYPRLSAGGYVIIDDWSIEPCRAAVEDFRTRCGIRDPIEQIDWTGCFWRRSPA